MPRRSSAPARRVSIGRMVQSMERTMRATNRSPRTIYSYTLSVRLFAEWLEANGRPTTVDVTRDDVREFLADQLGRNSPATALVRYKGLQQFFRHVVDEDELDTSPMAGVEPPKFEREPPPIIPDDVLVRLLRARSGRTLVDRRDTAILRVFLDTGCRLAEVTGLRIGDLDMGRQTITVRGKGDRVRVVTFGERTWKAVDRYLRQLERERPERVADDMPLWLGRQGRMSTSGLTNVLHRMCDDAGVPRLHWHAFRHTFAHTWLAEGGNEGDLMALAGWQSRSMVDIYARSARVERAHQAARRLSLGDRV